MTNEEIKTESIKLIEQLPKQLTVKDALMIATAFAVNVKVLTHNLLGKECKKQQLYYNDILDVMTKDLDF